MRLKPVSERPPQHARCRARRAALHHVVLAIKEIRGVTRIEGHRSESREGRKLCPRPLPSVPHQVMHAESARTRWMRPDRRRIPRFEIEISLGRAGPFLAPRIAALPHAVRRSISSAMKLRLGRQSAPQPFRVRGGLGVAHVNRPFQRQTNLAEHRAISPEVAFAPPEHRMLDAFFRFPVPGFLAPQRAVLVASRLDKAEKIVIRDVVILNRELVHLYFMSLKFVVPSEFIVMNA